MKVKQILEILQKYGTANKVKELAKEELSKTQAGDEKIIYPNINKFYNDIGMKQHNKTITVFPFLREIGEIFNPKQVKIEEFKKAMNQVSNLIHHTNFKLDNKLSAKKIIKKHLKAYHKPDDYENPYVAAWKKAGLFVQKDEFKEKNKKAETAVEKKNTNVLIIPIEKVEDFYRKVFFKEKKNIIDLIIAAQAAIGTRLIEILNSDVSTFKAIDGNKIEQKGTSKEIKGKYVEDDKIVIKQPVNLINNKQVIEWINEIRKETDKIKKIGNVKLREQYNGMVNKGIKKYLLEAEIPKHNELKSSHGLRRLWVNYSYSTRENQGQTLHNFIKKFLGHDSDGSTMNYNTIQVSSDSILTKDQSNAVNEALVGVRHNKQEIEELKIELEEKKEELKEADEPTQTVFSGKYKELDKLYKRGITSYRDLNDKGFTNYMISKYKRLRGLKNG